MRSFASSVAASLCPALLDLDLLDLDLDLVLNLEGDQLLRLPPKGDLDLDRELLYSPEYTLLSELSSLNLPCVSPSSLSMMNSDKSGTDEEDKHSLKNFQKNSENLKTSVAATAPLIVFVRNMLSK